MVRRPKIVWPGLDRMDLQRKMIAGDGNCLFASLADQLYGEPTKHDEIRASVIEHMRNFRPLFENVAIKDDIQQKRATRSTMNAIRSTPSDDPYEEYLAIMSKPGTYGGEPELVAFVQCFDQDVLIHLPRMYGYPESIPYSNEYRTPGTPIKATLHLCYGGDENTNAHYDSVRKNPPVVPILQRPASLIRDVSPSSSTSSTNRSLTSRAFRNSRSDITRDMMHEMVIKGSDDLKFTFEQLESPERARSPSVSSSHHSNSSKRSLDDDDAETHRTVKRADRRKSTRARPRTEGGTSNLSSTSIKVKLTSGLATPASTQDSEYSSEQSDHCSDSEKAKLKPRRKVVSRSMTPDTGSINLNSSRRGSINPSRLVENDIAKGISVDE